MTVQLKRQPPGSVRYVQGLLWTQAGCWCLVSVLFLVGVGGSLAQGSWPSAAGVALAASAAAALATAKIWLAKGLGAGSAGARWTALGAEVVMTCFGVFGLLGIDPSGGLPADMLVLPLIAGAGLSLAAVVVLLLPPARRYCLSQASGPSALRQSWIRRVGCAGLATGVAVLRHRCWIVDNE